MADKRVVIIIPNEEILDVPVFRKSVVSSKMRHMYLVREFAKEHNLEVETENTVAQMGHIVLELLNDTTALCFIPGRITLKQYDLLLKEANYLKNYKEFWATLLLPDGELDVDCLEYTESMNIVLYTMQLVKDLCVEKNLKNNKR